MSWLVGQIRSEPAAFGGLLSAVVALVFGLVLKVDPQILAGIASVDAALVAFVVRGQSTPTYTPPPPPPPAVL